MAIEKILEYIDQSKEDAGDYRKNYPRTSLRNVVPHPDTDLTQTSYLGNPADKTLLDLLIRLDAKIKTIADHLSLDLDE